MKYTINILAVTLFALLVSCCMQVGDAVFGATHRSYRMDPEAGSAESKESTIKHLKSDSGEAMTLEFLEFDDQGDLRRDPTSQTGWHPKSRIPVISLIGSDDIA